MTKRPAAPVIIDQRQADLRKIDGEIERLERQIAAKAAALDADAKKNLAEMDHGLQQRLDQQIVTLRSHVKKLHDDRFSVELGDIREPENKPAAVAAAPVKHRAWEIEPVRKPTYPSMIRTAENHSTFSDALQGFIAHAIYKKNATLKDVGCHPDQRADLDLVATISAQGEATFAWLSHRCEALEQRLAQIESRATLAYKGVWQRDAAYRRGDVCTHQGSSWHCDLDQSQGLQPGEGLGWKLMVKKGRDARS